MAREALAEAQIAGAPERAPDEYKMAWEALRDAENLIRHKNYTLARQVLPVAASHGYRATFKAREERLRSDAEKKVETLKNQQKMLAQQKEISRKKEPESIQGKKHSLPLPATPPPLPTRYEVKKEESLWAIASLKDIYGEPLLWPIIYKANRDQIKDPRQVFPGQVLSIPRKPTTQDKEKAIREAHQSEFFPVERSAIPSENLN